MRQTYTDLQTICSNGAGKDTATATATFFKQRINARAEFILAKLPSWLSETTRTFSTVEDQQYYHYPPNFREIKSLVIEINSVSYPLTPIFSNQRWKELNAITIQAGAIPTHYFKRQRDFGFWPIPQDEYTATIEYALRAGGMTKSDYVTGTVTVVENDETVTGSDTTWTGGNAAADMWFSLTDSEGGESKGGWYRIGSVTDATHLELESVFEETGASSQYYTIGECPELPPEGHELCAWGALADYFLSFRQSPTKASFWSNMFWTGDPTYSLNLAENNIKPWAGGGLLGLIHAYRDRDTSQLIERGPGRTDTITQRRASSSISE